MRLRVVVLFLSLGALAGVGQSTPAAAWGPDPAAVRAMVHGLRLWNWFPTQGAHDRMWTDFDPAAIDHDLATIAALHGNAVRVILDLRAFTFPSPPAKDLDELSRTVSLAAAHGLRVELTLFDQFSSYEDIDGSREWADAVLARIAPRDPRIAFIELMNEIAPDDENAMRWARQLLPYVRERSGGIPVTVSVDAPASRRPRCQPGFRA